MGSKAEFARHHFDSSMLLLREDLPQRYERLGLSVEMLHCCRNIEGARGLCGGVSIGLDAPRAPDAIRVRTADRFPKNQLAPKLTRKLRIATEALPRRVLQPGR